MWQDLFLKSTLTLNKNKQFWLKFSKKEDDFSWTVFCGEYDFFHQKKQNGLRLLIFFFKNGLFSPLYQ
jgi:hypothetical protein